MIRIFPFIKTGISALTRFWILACALPPGSKLLKLKEKYKTNDIKRERPANQIQSRKKGNNKNIILKQKTINKANTVLGNDE